MKDDRVYLRHILRCISRIQEYTAGGREAFFSSALIQDGTLRNLQTMAESTQRLSAELKSRRPDIGWPALAGFRNTIVHDYMGVDLEQIYRAVEHDVPLLRQACEFLLQQVPKRE